MSRLWPILVYLSPIVDKYPPWAASGSHPPWADKSLSRVYHGSITDAPNLSRSIKSLFALQSGIVYHKGYCNAIGRGQPWASVCDVETRQPGGASIAARRVGWQHGGNGATNPHRGGRVRSVVAVWTVCEQMRCIALPHAAQGLSLIHISEPTRPY